MSDSPLKDFEPKSLQSIIKLGGKKKLDTLLELFRKEAPQRVNEIEGPDAEESKAAAKVLKISCANLGLHALEETCEQVLAGEPGSAGRARPALQKALAWLEAQRKAI
jgi:HPt (histidine-containing phosphotransfer) domain-containing protein